MIAFWLGVAYLVLLFAKIALATRAARRGPQPSSQSQDFSAIVIAQPILSGDPRLSDTLEDNVRALPSARFVWLVDSDDRDAQDRCAALAGRYSRTRIEVVVAPPPPDKCNPKLFKLERVRPLVGNNTLLVLDDDTRISPASLSAMLSGLETSELATGLPAYLDGDYWPSQLLSQFVNNNAALTYLPLLNFWPPPTINGMAYAIRGSTLDQLGGFAPLINHLTDDLAVAGLVLASGGRISQTAWPQWVQTTVRDRGQYVRMMHRWFVFARLLLQHQPRRMQLAIALLHAMPSALLWAVAITAAVERTWIGLAMLVGVLVVRAVALMALQQRFYGRSLHRPVVSVISELLQPIHLLHASFVRTIVWRTRRYVVRDVDSFQSA
jgi:ceramide glucosyltransferase